MRAQRDDEWDAYKAAIVEAANRTGAEMAGCGIEALRLLVAAHDVAFGVYQDRREPDGVGMLLIKGQQAMRDVIAEGTPAFVSLTAIPCTSAEEAEAMRRVIGEKQALH
jgi:hypothetical protein